MESFLVGPGTDECLEVETTFSPSICILYTISSAHLDAAGSLYTKTEMTHSGTDIYPFDLNLNLNSFKPRFFSIPTFFSGLGSRKISVLVLKSGF